MRIIALSLLFAAFAYSQAQESSVPAQVKDKIPVNSVQQERNPKLSQPYIPSQTWELKSDENPRIAMVSASSKTPDGETQTVLKLQCPKTKIYVTSFSYIVRNTDKIPSFNFDNFEGPGAPDQTKNLVLFEAKSPTETLKWRFAPTGAYGCNWESNAFCFSPSSENKPDKTVQLLRMIAKGGTEVTITVFDYQDSKKSIKTRFPAIDSKSEVAKGLNGCK